MTMRESRSIDKEKTKEIDYDSFLQQEESDQSFQEGTAQLVRHIKSDEAETLGFAEDSEIFEVEKSLSDEKGYLIVEDSDWAIINSWTGTSDIHELAGSFVPVRKESEELYQVHEFENIRSELDLGYDELNYLYENNCIEYENGDWVVTSVWEEHNSFIRKTQSITSFIGFVSAISSVGFLTATTNVTMYVLLLSVWVTTLIVQTYLSGRKKRPIETVLNNIN